MKVVVKRPEDPSRLSTLSKIVIINLSIVLIVYVYLLTSRTNISEAYFTERFIYRSNPRDEFAIVKKDKFNRNMVNLGSHEAKSNVRLLVVSLVRNCSGSIPCMEKKVGVLSSVFKSVHVALFENNSSDDTRRILLEYSVRGNKKFGGDNVTLSVVNPFSLVENEDVCQVTSKEFENNVKAGIHGAGAGRINRMVYLRNRSLDYIYEHQSKYDMLLMTDMDIIGRIFPVGIQETVGYLRSMKDIGFVTFRGFFSSGGFFDPFSYRGTSIITKPRLMTFLLCMISYFTIPSGQGLKPMTSSHSGGIFSNLPLSPHLRYDLEHVVTIPGVTNINLCEHITFMERVPNNFVNTNMTFLVRDNV